MSSWTKWVLNRKPPAHHPIQYDLVFIELANSDLMFHTMKRIFGNVYHCYEIASFIQTPIIENTFTYILDTGIVVMVLSKKELEENGFNVV